MKNARMLMFLTLAVALLAPPVSCSASGQFWLDTYGESAGTVSPGLILPGRAAVPTYVGPYRVTAPGVAEVDSLSRYWMGKANEFYLRGSYDLALTYNDKALVANPTLEIAWCNKGNALLALGRYPEALIAFETAISINQNDEWAWAGKSNALRALGQESDAETAQLKAKDLGYSETESYLESKNCKTC
jgi:tetratricopeptide (TPR) repeat protein